MGVKAQPVLYNSMTYETYVPQSYHTHTILTRLPPSNMTMQYYYANSPQYYSMHKIIIQYALVIEDYSYACQL